MSKDAWLVAAGDQSGFGSGTNFFAAGSCGRFVGNATEAQDQSKVRAGTVDKYRFFVAASSATAQLIMGDRINGVNGVVLGSQVAGTTGEFEDLTHSDTVADGDLFVIRGTGSVGAQTTTISGMSGVHYVATASIATMGAMVGNTNFQATALATSYFGTILGGYHASILGTTESAVQHRVRAPMSLSFFRVDVTSNTVTGSSTYVLRKTGVSATGTAVFGATTTGIVEDTTHTDTFASADLANFLLSVPSTSNNIQASIASVTVVGSNQQFDACTECPGAQGSTTLVNYTQLVGGAVTEATEANRQYRFRFASSASNLRINTTSNSTTGFTWKFRLNGVDGTQAVVQGSSTTGYVEDLTHKDAISSADLANYSMSTSSSVASQSAPQVTLGLTNNNAAIGTVFGAFSQNITATNLDAAGIATVFGRFSQTLTATDQATFRGPITTVFGLFSQVVVATDVGIRGTGIRRFWTF